MYKKKKISPTTLLNISILIILLSNGFLFAQNKVNSISVNPLNRLILSFDKTPESFTSELSQDKKFITLKIDEQFFEIDTVLKFEGIISKAEIKSSPENLLIKIELKDRRGYSIANIPYSNSLFIDVFQWNTLTEGEDKFRTSLIALESKVKNTAYLDLVEAIKKDTKEAAVIFGLNLIKDGNVLSAKKLLEYSFLKGDTNIYEIYAGLSDVYNSQGNLAKSNEFSEKYLLKSKTKSLNFLLNNLNNPQDTTLLYLLSFLDSLMPKTTIDTSNKLANDTTKVVKIDSTKNEEEIIDSSIIEYAIYLLLAILLLIIYFYVKWRNQRMNEIIDSKKIKISENKKEQKPNKDAQNKPINKKLANIYKSNEKIEDDKLPEKDIKKTELEKITEQSEKSKTLLDIVKKVQDENKKSEIKEIKNYDQEIITHNKLPAKIEVAMNIAQEQKRIKEQSLEEFNALSLPTDIEKLNEISKKLGIEMSGFEIRKQMDKIMKSSKEMEELKNKFTNRTE